MKAHPLLAVAALVVSLWGGPALAQAQVQEAVALSGLDLGTAKGQAAARRRIRAAAARLCAQPRSPLLPQAETIAWRCRKDARARAEAELTGPARGYARMSD